MAVNIVIRGRPFAPGGGSNIVRLAYQESDGLRRFGGFDLGAKFFRVAGIANDVEKNKIVEIRPPQRACFADVRGALHIRSQLSQHPRPQVAPNIIADHQKNTFLAGSRSQGLIHKDSLPAPGAVIDAIDSRGFDLKTASAIMNRIAAAISNSRPMLAGNVTGRMGLNRQAMARKVAAHK